MAELEASGTDKKMKVTGEQAWTIRDVELELANGVLAIKGKKASETHRNQPQ